MIDIKLGDTHDFKFTSRRFSTGAPFTLAGTPVISAYPDNSTTELTAGITLTTDFDARTGLNNVRVVASSANGYATGSNYALVITAGTVDSVSVVGEVVAQFTIERSAAHQRLGAPAGVSVSADVAAIKAKTDTIPANPTSTSDIPSAATIATQVRTELTTELGRIDAAVTTRATPAQVNAEVVDVLTVDTFVEPTTVPAATCSLKDRLCYLFTRWSNKRTQTSSTETIYQDDGTTVLATASKADDATTLTKGKDTTA